MSRSLDQFAITVREHFEYPPSTWTVTKKDTRLWVVVRPDGVEVDRATTKRAATEAITTGMYQRVWLDRDDWYRSGPEGRKPHDHRSRELTSAETQIVRDYLDENAVPELLTYTVAVSVATTDTGEASVHNVYDEIRGEVALTPEPGAMRLRDRHDAVAVASQALPADQRSAQLAYARRLNAQQYLVTFHPVVTAATVMVGPAHTCWEDPEWTGDLAAAGDCAGCDNAKAHPCPHCGYGRAWTTHNPDSHDDIVVDPNADVPDEWANNPHSDYDQVAATPVVPA